MKNLKLMMLPLILFGLMAVSCSDDDDSSNGNSDSIVGTWKVTDAWQNGESMYDQLLLVAYCSLQNEYNFLNDNSLRIDTFIEGDAPMNCVEGETQTGSWSEEDGVYSVNINDETSSTTVDFSDTNHFTTELDFEGQIVKLEFTRQ